MSKSKSTKPETKSVAKTTTRKVIKEPAVKEGVIDTLYQNILDKAVSAYRMAQASSLIWSWELGQLFDEFKRTVVGKLPGRTTEVFLRDLAERDIPDVAESTLYVAIRIFEKYKREALTDMAKAGFGTAIVKTLLSLEKEPDVLAKVSAALVKTDGTVITILELNKLVAKFRQASHTSQQTNAIENTAKIAASTPTPRESKEGRTVGNVMADVSESGTVSSEDETKAPAAAAKPDDGKTGSRGATPVKTYSASPQKALKATDNAAIKLMAGLGDTIIAATEITKIGFDHPPTKEAVRVLLASAKTGLSELLTALPEVVSRLQEALDDVSG